VSTYIVVSILLLHLSPSMLPREPLSSKNIGLYLPFPTSYCLEIPLFIVDLAKAKVTCSMA
jgi:hypothetical protein